MEVLKPIYAAIALLGTHILKPYHHLLMKPDTNYSTLLKAFPQLHNEPTTIPAEKLLTKEQVFFFVDKDTFTYSLPDKDLIEALDLLQ